MAKNKLVGLHYKLGHTSFANMIHGSSGSRSPSEQRLAISCRSRCKKVIIKVKHLKAKFYFEET